MKNIVITAGYSSRMERAFVVLRSRGPAWDDSKSLEAQAEWAAHAAFMDGLFEQGFAALVGPLEGTRDGSSFCVHSAQPKLSSASLQTRGRPTTFSSPTQISPWQVRLGTLA